MAWIARTVTTTTSQLLPYSPSRRGLAVHNNGTARIFISQEAANVSSQGFPVDPGVVATLIGSKEAPVSMPLYAVADSGSQNVRVNTSISEGEGILGIDYPGAARPAYYDRNPLTTGLRFFGRSVASHAETIRATYTVPAGKKAKLGVFHVAVMRDAVATTANEMAAYVIVQLNAGATRTEAVWILRIQNTVGVTDQGNGQGGETALLASDVISLATSDSSTGGSGTYTLGAAITEYDA